MASLVKRINDYVDYLYSFEDPRTKDWFLLERPPYTIIGILILYFILVKYGPEWMQNKGPYELKLIMTVYNLVQVVTPFALLPYPAYIIFIKHRFDYRCEPILFGTDEKSLNIMRFGYIYIIFKFVDLLDTVFIVLKKNNRQLSFLHCYHHSVMAAGGYFILKWWPGGSFILLGFVNSLVHGLMYLYYLLSMYFPKLKHSQTWKRNITHIQMAQFAFLVFAFARPLFEADCQFPKFWSCMMTFQNFLMLYMFGKFYIETYMQKDKKKKKKGKKN